MINNKHNRHIASAALFLTLLGSNALSAGNLVRDGSYEKPVVPNGSFTLFSNGQAIDAHWTVVGATGNVAVVSGNFTQNGFTFPAKKGVQWVDLTGYSSNSATGTKQTISTVAGQNYALTFFIGNVYNPGGIFGTRSTVDLQIDGVAVASFTNIGGQGTTALSWRKFSTDFVAAGTQTTIAFINGDPSNDNSNGIDAVSVVLDPD
jgi:hypothetical protein